MKSFPGAVLLLMVAFASAATGSPSLPEAAPAGSPARTTVRLEREGNQLFVTALVANRVGRFLLDTASERTILSIDTARAAGVTAGTAHQINGIGQNPLSAEESGPTAVQVGELAVQDLPLLVADIHAGGLAKEADGILGWDFLRNFVSVIDLDRGTLTLSTTAPSSETRAWLPLILEGGLPAVTALLDVDGRSIPLVLEIDSGATRSLMLRREVVDRYAISDDSPIVTVASGIGGNAEFAMRRIDSLKIGSETIDHPIAEVSRARSGVSASRSGSSGVIGVAILESFRITIDPMAQRVAFEPSARFNRRTEYRHYGLGIESAGDLRVTSVTPSSPAARSGLREGDLVERANGVLDPKDSLDSITRAMRRGDLLQLEVTRGTERLAVVIKPIRLD